MKLIHLVWMFLALLLMGAAVCHAVPVAPPVPITATWTYAGDTVELAGFRLYRGNTLVCDIPDKAARMADCTDAVPYGDQNSYHMTAYNLEGVEGGVSAPFVLPNHAKIPGVTGWGSVKKK